jgi:hypothetical protein
MGSSSQGPRKQGQGRGCRGGHGCQLQQQQQPLGQLHTAVGVAVMHTGVESDTGQVALCAAGAVQQLGATHQVAAVGMVGRLQGLQACEARGLLRLTVPL